MCITQTHICRDCFAKDQKTTKKDACQSQLISRQAKKDKPSLETSWEGDSKRTFSSFLYKVPVRWPFFCFYPKPRKPSECERGKQTPSLSSEAVAPPPEPLEANPRLSPARKSAEKARRPCAGPKPEGRWVFRRLRLLGGNRTRLGRGWSRQTEGERRRGSHVAAAVTCSRNSPPPCPRTVCKPRCCRSRCRGC